MQWIHRSSQSASKTKQKKIQVTWMKSIAPISSHLVSCCWCMFFQVLNCHGSMECSSSYSDVLLTVLLQSSIEALINCMCSMYRRCTVQVQGEFIPLWSSSWDMINLTEVGEDPNQSSEEPKASFAEEGKPWSITTYFQLMQLLFIYGIVH